MTLINFRKCTIKITPLHAEFSYWWEEKHASNLLPAFLVFEIVYSRSTLRRVITEKKIAFVKVR